MKYKGMALLLISILVFAGCQAPVVEAPTETPDVAEVTEETSEEADVAVAEEEKKRIEGPFKDMIAPDFTLPDVEGNNVTLSDLQGNSVALVFWTSW